MLGDSVGDTVKKLCPIGRLLQCGWQPSVPTNQPKPPAPHVSLCSGHLFPRPSPKNSMSGHRTPPGQTFLCGTDDRFCLAALMILESLEKGSQWLSFRSFAIGLPSFHLQWGHSSRVMSNTAASSSPDLGKGYLQVWWMASSFDPHWRCGCLWHGQRGSCRGRFPNCSIWYGVVAKRAARDMFPVSNCKGYMSTPWALGGQPCKATPQASRKDPPFFLYGLALQVLHTFTKGLFQGMGMICTGGLCLLMAAVHITSASQIMAVQWAITSLIASVVLASFWCMVVPILDTSLLWWESMVALVVSSHPMATFISLCSWSTSSGKAPGSALGESQSMEQREHWLQSELLMQGGWWVTDWDSGEDVIGYGCMLWCLWGSGHWLQHGWACFLQAEWVFYSGGGGAPKATDGSFLPGMMYWETGIDIMG